MPLLTSNNSKASGIYIQFPGAERITFTWKEKNSRRSCNFYQHSYLDMSYQKSQNARNFASLSSFVLLEAEADDEIFFSVSERLLFGFFLFFFF